MNKYCYEIIIILFLILYSVGLLADTVNYWNPDLLKAN